jgi:diguanylate cyclase (GGDEF)-like protein
MATIVAEIPEIERLFDTTLLETEVANSVLEQAREVLTFRTMQTLEHMTTLEANSAEFEARTAELEHKHRRDPLTGVFNRGHLDEVLAKEFQSSVAGGWPLSIVFADLDRFKLVNDTYGHPAGDTVLVETAKLILEVTRDTDCVARYGGEEFVIVLPGLGADAADRVCERLLARLRATQHVLVGALIRATASLGRATHSTSTPFASVADLIAAADRCVYAAKKSGRDRLVSFNPKTLVDTG